MEGVVFGVRHVDGGLEAPVREQEDHIEAGQEQRVIEQEVGMVKDEDGHADGAAYDDVDEVDQED